MFVNSKEEKRTLIYTQNASELYMGNSLTLRKMTKHILTLVFSIYLFIIIWQVKSVPLEMEELIKLAWKASIYSSLVVIYKKSIKLLHMLNNELYLISAILIVYVIYGSVLTFVASNVKIDDVKQLYKTTYWLVPATVFANVVWFPVMAFFERKTKPFYSKVLIFQAIASLSSTLTAIAIHLLITKIVLVEGSISFNIRDKSTISTLMLGVSTVIISASIYIYIFFSYKSFLVDPFATKTTSYATAVVSVVPVTLWFVSNVAVWRNNGPTWIYLGVMAILLAILLLFGFSKKNQINSSKIYFSINSFIIAIAWVASFYFISQWKTQINSNFARSLALIITSVAAILTYWRSSPSPNAFASFLYRTMMWVLILLVIFIWAISKVNILPAISFAITDFSINELLSAVIMVFPILTFFFSIFSWFTVLGKMNRNYRRMNKAKEKQMIENNMKEVIK